jgi:hypothetical protein
MVDAGFARSSTPSSTRRSSASRSPIAGSSRTRSRCAGVAPSAAVHVGDLYAVDVVGAAGAGIHPVLLDPNGDWPAVDCAVAPNLGAIVDRIAGARA